MQLSKFLQLKTKIKLSCLSSPHWILYLTSSVFDRYWSHLTRFHFDVFGSRLIPHYKIDISCFLEDMEPISNTKLPFHVLGPMLAPYPELKRSPIHMFLKILMPYARCSKRTCFFERDWSHIQDFLHFTRRIVRMFRATAFPKVSKCFISQMLLLPRIICSQNELVISCIFFEISWCHQR